MSKEEIINVLRIGINTISNSNITDYDTLMVRTSKNGSIIIYNSITNEIEAELFLK